MIATLQRDGTRVVWLQRADSLTLNKYSFDSDGALAFIVIYRIDPHGNPLNCRIYDKYQTELFKGSYGYRKSNGELVEERFFDSRTKHLSPSGDEIPVRRIIFSDVRGKAFEPVVITDPLACMGDELAEFPAEPFHNPFMLKHEN